MIIYIVEAVLVVVGLTSLSVRERRMKRRESELTQKYIREGMTEDSARLRVFLETSPFVIREGTFEPPAGTLGEHAILPKWKIRNNIFPKCSYFIGKLKKAENSIRRLHSRYLKKTIYQ